LANWRAGSRHEAESQRLKDEAAKLGQNAAARIVAVQDFIAAQIGHDRAGDMASNLTTAAQIEGWEKIIANARTRSASSSSQQQHREPPRESPNERGKWTEEQYQKASARERLDYVRQFAQPTTNGGASR
jgi:hypothetical protein